MLNVITLYRSCIYLRLPFSVYNIELCELIVSFSCFTLFVYFDQTENMCFYVD